MTRPSFLPSSVSEHLKTLGKLWLRLRNHALGKDAVIGEYSPLDEMQSLAYALSLIPPSNLEEALLQLYVMNTTLADTLDPSGPPDEVTALLLQAVANTLDVAEAFKENAELV